MRPLPSFRDKSVLVVSPHPDDEAIAAFGVIHRAAREAMRVGVVVVTDGAASHDSRKWPPRRLARQRARETQAAMARAGLSRGQVSFLGLPDSGLERLSEEEFARLVRALRGQVAPDLVFRPSVKDYHGDHKVVARACGAAWPARVRQFSYVVWPEETSRFKPKYRLPLGAALSMKHAAIRSYRSQTGLVDDDPAGFTMSRAMIAGFCPPAETFEPV